ncbi:MAG: hypothetical protein AB7F64_06315 [Gammaproteobacteria bacterium]
MRTSDIHDVDYLRLNILLTQGCEQTVNRVKYQDPNNPKIKYTFRRGNYAIGESPSFIISAYDLDETNGPTEDTIYL